MQETENTPSQSPAFLAARLSAARGSIPPSRFAKQLGCSPDCLLRALASLPIREGTRLLLEKKLAELENFQNGEK